MFNVPQWLIISPFQWAREGKRWNSTQASTKAAVSMECSLLLLLFSHSLLLFSFLFISIAAVHRPYKRDPSSQWSVLHPSLDRVYNKFMLDTFERLMVEDHVKFEDAGVQAVLLQHIPPEVAEPLKEAWANKDTVAAFKWKQFKASMIESFKDGRITQHNPILDVVFRYCYPRLDINVSKGLNHLLKSPFVVHPSTGNVCVPLDPKTIDRFELAKVPKLANIMAQLDAGKGTEMDAAVADFRRLFLDPLDASIRQERIAMKQQEHMKAEPMEF